MSSTCLRSSSGPTSAAEVARIGVEDLQPVADPASGLLGPRREFPAQGQDGGRVAGAPLDLAAEGLAEVDAEPYVARRALPPGGPGPSGR